MKQGRSGYLVFLTLAFEEFLPAPILGKGALGGIDLRSIGIKTKNK